MSRIQLNKLIVSLNTIGKNNFSMNKGLYPPKLNDNKELEEKEMISEINKFIKYLKTPDYSYLTKKQS